MWFGLFFLIFYNLFENMEPFYKYYLYLCPRFGEKSGLTNGTRYYFAHSQERRKL